MATDWAQKKVSVGSRKRGCHVITREIMKQVPEIGDFEMGLANFFSAHLLAMSMCVRYGQVA